MYDGDGTTVKKKIRVGSDMAEGKGNKKKGIIS